MTSPPIDPTDEVLEGWLRDLGAHLDLGQGETPEGRSALVAAVLDGLDTTPGSTGRPSHGRGFRSHRVLAAAAIVVVALAVLLAVAPAREAIADWFGIGSVRISRSDAPPSTDGLPDRTTPASRTDLDDLDDVLPFEVRLADADRYGRPVAFVDPGVPSGLVELRYEGFSLVELASRPDELPVLSKQLGPGTDLTGVTVRGVDGFWLSGDVHEVMSVRPDGDVVVETLRRAGDVLVWEEDGVTYRVEGLDSLDAALDVASSIG